MHNTHSPHTRRVWRLISHPICGVTIDYYHPQTKFAKVMFLQVFVCPQGKGMHGRGGHVWWEGGVCGGGGHVWKGGVHGGGVCGRPADTTRMHSSRMRTGRSLTVCCSLLPGGGLSAWSGGVLLGPGVCGGSPWSGGGSAWSGGVLPGPGGFSLV